VLESTKTGNTFVVFEGNSPEQAADIARAAGLISGESTQEQVHQPILIQLAHKSPDNKILLEQ
jgi:hypothetical protein